MMKKKCESVITLIFVNYLDQSCLPTCCKHLEHMKLSTAHRTLHALFCELSMPHMNNTLTVDDMTAWLVFGYLFIGKIFLTISALKTYK